MIVYIRFLEERMEVWKRRGGKRIKGMWRFEPKYFISCGSVQISWVTIVWGITSYFELHWNSTLHVEGVFYQFNLFAVSHYLCILVVSQQWAFLRKVSIGNEPYNILYLDIIYCSLTLTMVSPFFGFPWKNLGVHVYRCIDFFLCSFLLIQSELW